jgi:muconate cycloisomerase
MKIVAIDCRLISLPTIKPHRWASLTVDVGSYVLVNVQTDEGVSGWGEATALAQWGGDYGRYYGETPQTVMHVIRDLLWPVLKGGDPARHQELNAAMDAQVRGHNYARTAIDAALLDVVAQRAGLPVYELLGGRRRDRIPMAHSVGLMPVDEAVQRAKDVVDEGMRTVKVKVGEDIPRDLVAVRKVFEAVGDRVDVTVDANQGWGPPAVAKRILKQLSDLPIRFVEQPVEGLSEMAWLAREVDVPLMVDESMWTAHDMAEVARQHAAHLASIYTTKAGGLHRAVQADAVAYATGIGTNVNGSSETGVGNLANVHVAAAMASLREASVFPITGLKGNRPTEIAGATYVDDVLTEPFRFEEGCIVVPDGPGWGIPVDEEKVEFYTRERVTIRD